MHTWSLQPKLNATVVAVWANAPCYSILEHSGLPGTPLELLPDLIRRLIVPQQCGTVTLIVLPLLLQLQNLLLLLLQPQCPLHCKGRRHVVMPQKSGPGVQLGMHEPLLQQGMRMLLLQLSLPNTGAGGAQGRHPACLASGALQLLSLLLHTELRHLLPLQQPLSLLLGRYISIRRAPLIGQGQGAPVLSPWQSMLLQQLLLH